MNIEKKLKIFLLSLAVLSFCLFLLYFSNLRILSAVFLVVALMTLSALIFFEAYLRLQHNIDIKAGLTLNGIEKLLAGKMETEKDLNDFKKDIINFFEKLLEDLEDEKQKSDVKFLQIQEALDRKIEIVFSRFEYAGKENSVKMDKISEKNEVILASLKAFWSLYKLNENTSIAKPDEKYQRLIGKFGQLENKIKELENKVNGRK